MRIARTPAELERAFETASSEAEKAFGDGAIYLEKYLEEPRHIEFQVLGDRHGNIVHLGERECSVQRRSQKVVEESPSVAVDDALREKLGAAAVAIAHEAGYENAGTIEFLLAPDGSFYFIEANARLQVEHPVTEAVTGLDLVRQQLRVAAGEPLGFSQADIRLRGWAIECRITAEDADNGFMPALGIVQHVSEPSGPSVRVDSSLFDGYEVGPHYDSLLSKLIAYGSDREHALACLRRALDEYQVLGVTTTLSFHRRLADDPAFIAGEIDTRFLDRRFEPTAPAAAHDDDAMVVAALLSHQRRGSGNGVSSPEGTSRWRTAARHAAADRAPGGGRWRSIS
jgi:acetyl-CoA carboxylase biotin carboxylase subunit